MSIAKKIRGAESSKTPNERAMQTRRIKYLTVFVLSSISSFMGLVYIDYFVYFALAPVLLMYIFAGSIYGLIGAFRAGKRQSRLANREST